MTAPPGPPVLINGYLAYGFAWMGGPNDGPAHEANARLPVYLALSTPRNPILARDLAYGGADRDEANCPHEQADEVRPTIYGGGCLGPITKNVEAVVNDHLTQIDAPR